MEGSSLRTGSRATMMVEMPQLDEVTRRLKDLTRDLSGRSAKCTAQLYSSAVGLLCLLQVDRALLQEKLHGRNADAGLTCPTPDEIPAVTAVLQDADLFRALIRCLHATSDDHERQQLYGRKRSLSVSAEPVANKAFKTTYSPVPPSSRQKFFALPQQLTDFQRRPNFNVQVLAATILFLSFQHLDHWPAPLLKAYADDCFGPRLWVDDEQCRPLVENLALVHSDVDESSLIECSPEQIRAESAIVAKAYADFVFVPLLKIDPDFLKESQVDSAHRRGSLSSTGSHSLSRRPSLPSTTAGPDEGRRINMVSHDSELSRNKGSKRKVNGEDSDSSSGDEDEEVEEVVVTKSKGLSSARTPQMDAKLNDEHSVQGLYPLIPTRLNLLRVRQRFFGENMDLARQIVSSSLAERLDAKAKQNSGLLQSLPSFVSIPTVREMIANNLEKWLQSPALAGLARALFSSTVSHMKNVDPPLEEDLRAIDSILAMRLKANQLNAHIDNVTVIAKGIPTATVVDRMYAALIPEILPSSDTTDSSGHLKMTAAIHRVVPSQISYDAMASTLLTLLLRSKGSTGSNNRDERNGRMKKLRFIMRSLTTELSPNFDACALMKAFLSFDVSDNQWTLHDEEDKARLMFQSIAMEVTAQYDSVHFEGTKLRHHGSNGWSPASKKRLRALLHDARKLLLTWCCHDYGPRCYSKRASQDSIDAVVCAADFRSTLGPSVIEEKVPSWLKTMRCLLFLEDADSATMRTFLGVDATDDLDWVRLLPCLRLCCEYGRDLTDELIWVVINACSKTGISLPSEMGITLLEHLFKGCSNEKKGGLTVSDPTIAWELYNLTQFTYTKPIVRFPSNAEGAAELDALPQDETGDYVSRLAHPGLWWRVTILVLIMSSKATSRIGAVVWKENPTMCSLMKMIVSSRYRFPTVDCDDSKRDEMKKAEQAARDIESKLAERMFLPRKSERKGLDINKSGMRVSKRLLKQQQEREAEKELAESARRKKLLKVAQKTIMLWDPDGPARKPPREVAELLLSVEALFDISEVLQRSIEPDFLLMTIGGTSRGAIERAYDWLIPIISKFPDTIGRLPSSASCFLLLRAYGSDADERAQLKELSAPLLSHVASCLEGNHGKQDCVKAFDLLMSDVASHKADRRRCARRVLSDALRSQSSKTWQLLILELKYADALVGDGIKYMSVAATFERGRVLKTLIMALEKYLTVAEGKCIETGRRFSDLLFDLISSRPSVFADAMIAFSDLQDLVVHVVHSEFVRRAKSAPTDQEKAMADMVRLKSFHHSGANGDYVFLPLTLLLSAILILSISKGSDGSTPIEELGNALLRGGVSIGNQEDDMGISSATIVEGDRPAVGVESWIMLAKARSDDIARRAALSAPTVVLPRLLLCSGLPRSSLVTMIDRLGQLGDSADEEGDIYQKLLVSSTSGEMFQRRGVARKLLGRLAAYIRLNKLEIANSTSPISTTFLSWLTQECQNQVVKSSKHKNKKLSKSSSNSPRVLSNRISASSVLSNLSLEVSPGPLMAESQIELQDFVQDARLVIANECATKSNQYAMVFIQRSVEEGSLHELDRWLHKQAGSLSTFAADHTPDSLDVLALATHLLTCFSKLSHKDEATTRILLKWIPLLTESRGSPDLYVRLFATDKDASVLSALSVRCSQVWSPSHVEAFVKWIASAWETPLGLCPLRISQFLVSVSGAPSGHIDTLRDSTSLSGGALLWHLSDDEVDRLIGLSLAAIREDNLTEDMEVKLCNRNLLSPSALLVLLLAGKNKEAVRFVTDKCLNHCVQLSDREKLPVEAVLLRLYLWQPNWMDLGKSAVRMALIEATERFPRHWVQWRSTLDDNLENMLDGLVSRGDIKLVRPLSDISRSHPLLILRVLPYLCSVLEEDATIREESLDASTSNRKVHGKNVAKSPTEAVMLGKVVRVVIRHWGYSYNESLWLALLEIITSIPNELLFHCGLRLGVLNLLTLYLHLVSVQRTLVLTNPVSALVSSSASASTSSAPSPSDRAARLSGKVKECLVAFQRTAPSEWKSWLGQPSTVSVSDGAKKDKQQEEAAASQHDEEIRYLLVRCDLMTPQEAIDSLQQSSSSDKD